MLLYTDASKVRRFSDQFRLLIAKTIFFTKSQIYTIIPHTHHDAIARRIEIRSEIVQTTAKCGVQRAVLALG